MSEIKAYVTVEKDQCKGCELCIESCPKELLSLSTTFNKLGHLFIQFEDKDNFCKACKACFYACPEPGALAVTKEVY